MTVPTTCARAAVRQHHRNGAAAARAYLVKSKVGSWVSHSNASMASNAQAVVDGLDWYASMDASDGRRALDFDQSTVVTLGPSQVKTTVDVVLEDGDAVAARIIMWDAPPFDARSAPIAACAFAIALQLLFPGRHITTIGIWNARRQQHFEIPLADALAAQPMAISTLQAL